jgi:hypothetical protein
MRDIIFDAVSEKEDRAPTLFASYHLYSQQPLHVVQRKGVDITATAIDVLVEIEDRDEQLCCRHRC